MENRFSFPIYIVIESQVVLDKRLNEIEKVLYGIICALSSNKKGECYATNSYLARFLNCDIRTIQRAIESLKGCKYITTSLINQNKRVITPTINSFMVDRANKPELFDFDWLNERGD